MKSAIERASMSGPAHLPYRRRGPIVIEWPILVAVEARLHGYGAGSSLDSQNKWCILDVPPEPPNPPVLPPKALVPVLFCALPKPVPVEEAPNPVGTRRFE